MPVYVARELALEAVNRRALELRRRVRAELPRSRGSLATARGLLTDSFTEWDIRDMIPIAATVATVFIENVLDHTDSAPVLIAESYRDAVTVAVEDASARLPGRHEDAYRGAEIVSGLAIVSALSRVWGATPTSSGKTVWALIGSENQF